MWTTFLIGLMAGIAATPHCLGMCGGFPLHLAKSSRRGPLARQLIFVAGKTFTYVFLGAMAAALGIVLFKDTSLSKWVPGMRIAAGVVTAIFGLAMLGFRLPRSSGGIGKWVSRNNVYTELGFTRSIFSPLLASPGPGPALTLGLMAGFLPCPLPMGMLAAAAASHSIGHAMALMCGVGLGTAPGLLAVGLFGVGLNRRFSKIGLRAAGIVVVTIGLLTIGRASGIISTSHHALHTASCCESEAAPAR